MHAQQKVQQWIAYTSVERKAVEVENAEYDPGMGWPDQVVDTPLAVPTITSPDPMTLLEHHV